jgi:hypothetical protein
MQTLTVTRKLDLIEHRTAIEYLFYNCFGQRPISSVWDWAYLDNPSGEPIVSLCYDQDNLVGHYAVVPMPLEFGDVRKNSYISMTTMVAESHRRFGLFTQMAQETYRIATEGGVDFVFGFPNRQSTPGFRKYLNWDLPESDYVATIDKSTLLALAKAGCFNKTNLLTLNLNDPVLRSWRLSRPGGAYTFQQGLAYKHRQDAVDLLWWDTAEAFDSIPDDVFVNILVSASSGLEPNRQFNYQFGGIGLCSVFDVIAINREMAISDIF